jgi:DNA primase
MSTPTSTSTPDGEAFLRELESVWNPVDLVLETGVATKPVREHQANLEIMCPFHDDGGYNCAVHKERGVYHCLYGGCEARGNLYKLLARLWGYDYPREFSQVVRRVAERYGMKPPRRGREDLTTEQRIQGALSLFVHAAQQHLRGPVGEGARDYLHRRGLTDESIDRFRLGYWPADAHLPCVKEPTAQCSVLWGDLAEAGLVVQEEAKAGRPVRWRKWFSDRILIPVRASGRVLNIQGRVPFAVPRGQRKVVPYLNLRGYRRAPWGLDQLPAVGEVVLVEGPFDAMLSTQAGVPTLALLGCHTEPEWLTRLPKGRGYVIASDGDAAGVQCLVRVGAALLGAGEAVSVVTLPEGQDPADVIEGQRAAGDLEGWPAMVKQATPLPVWMACRLKREQLGDPWKLDQALGPVLRLLACCGPIYAYGMVEQIARQIEVPAPLLLHYLRGMPKA